MKDPDFSDALAELTRLRAENNRSAVALAELRIENGRLRRAAVAFSKLVTCHQLCKSPSEKLFAELATARETLAETKKENDHG